MGLKQLSLFLLAIGTIVATTVAITMSQRDPILIPTLNLQGKQLPSSGLLGTIVSDVDGVRLLRYSASEAAAGIVLTGDEHNIFTCAQSGPLLSNSMQSDVVTRFWGYEYSGNEVANRRAGKVGRELFDGQFFISQGELTFSPQYAYFNELTTITPGKMYYFMQERDLGFMCGQGILGTLTCGNGTVEAGEQCDDNNVLNGDGCSNFCQVESSSSSSVSSQTSSFTIFRAHLDDNQNTSPTGSSATGDGFFSFNATTNVFTYDVAYSGLTSTVISGHIHGPAARGQDAGVVINLNPPSGTSGHLTGSVVLTGQQITDLFADHWYVNIHSQNHGAGEIRGQIEHGTSYPAQCPINSQCVADYRNCQAGTIVSGCDVPVGSNVTYGACCQPLQGSSSSFSSAADDASCFQAGFTCARTADVYTPQICIPGTEIGICNGMEPGTCCVAVPLSSSSGGGSSSSSSSGGGGSSSSSSSGGSSSQASSTSSLASCPYAFSCLPAASCENGTSIALCGTGNNCCVPLQSSSTSSQSSTSSSGGSSASSQSSTTSTSGGSSATSSAVSSSSTTGNGGSSSSTTSTSGGSSATSSAVSSSSMTSSSGGSSGSSSVTSQSSQTSSTTSGTSSTTSGTSSSSLAGAGNCGNGIPEAGEECDDGNTNNNDGCIIDVANSYECKLSICGDGYEWTQAGGTEECDDGNTVDGDGCFANCTLMIPPDA